MPHSRVISCVSFSFIQAKYVVATTQSKSEVLILIKVQRGPRPSLCANHDAKTEHDKKRQQKTMAAEASEDPSLRIN